MKTYTYEEALQDSLKYFGGEEFPAKVFLDKYALRNKTNELVESNPTQLHCRLAKELARIEKNKFKHPFTENEIFGFIDKFKFIIPQGSPMYGIGNHFQYTTLSNCYVLNSPLDAYSSIIYTDQELAQISKRRGGVGIDISNLRPIGTPTQNAARTSAGIVPFMERYSNTIREVGQYGRRGALMLTISVHHPQILDFIKVKADNTKVTGANISIRLTNEFLQAVENNTDYELRFPIDSKNPSISKFIKARDVWDQIIHYAWLRAEPGVIFWDHLIEESPADCYSEFGYRTDSTNPCGELPLCANDSCRLLLLNTYSFVKNHYKKSAFFDFEQFYHYCQIAQRLMDDIIDLEIESIDKIINKVNSDPEPDHIKKIELDLWEKIKIKCVNGRRTGTGLTAIGDTIASLNIKYGSDESINFVSKLYETLKINCYRSSVEMAKELGPFPIWNYELEKDNPFLNRIKINNQELYDDMKKYGRRNISLLTTPPAGTTSILCYIDKNIFGTTSGIEPAFMLSYTRRKKINPGDNNIRVDFIDQNGDSWQEYTIYHPAVKHWMEVTGEKDITKSPWYGYCAEDIDWVQRVKLQAAAQLSVDHSLSSTLNLPEDVLEKKVAEIYITAWKSRCKGITIYRKNCRTGVLIDKKIKSDKIQKTDAPKRPEQLICRVHHFVNKNQRYYVVVGLLNKDPYEIFAGLNYNNDGEIYIPKTTDTGRIIKKQRGKYFLIDNNENEYILTGGYSNTDIDALTRMISTGLRHGTDISFVVHQLEKTRGDLTSFAKVLSRALKEYIPDGVKIHGENCDQCQSSNLVREGGCIYCRDCGFSLCA